jgi:hypothetical protein
LSIDITSICSYMCDLTSWAHIWCVSDFVLKTRCYISSVFFCMLQLLHLDVSKVDWVLHMGCAWEVADDADKYLGRRGTTTVCFLASSTH